MKILWVISGLLFALNANAESCFNASEISAQAASPFAAAPDLEKAIIQAASDYGWVADKESANSSAYYIIGKIGAAGDEAVEVCVVLNNADELAYQVFTKKQGRESAGFMPLTGEKK